MAVEVLSVGQVTVNDDTLLIVPGSFSYDLGEPEHNVRALSAGSGTFEAADSIDGSTAKSVVKFEMVLTTSTDKNISTWKSNGISNSIKFTDETASGDSKTVSFTKMSLTNKVTRDVGADKTVSLQFEGDPGSAS